MTRRSGESPISNVRQSRLQPVGPFILAPAPLPSTADHGSASSPATTSVPRPAATDHLLVRRPPSAGRYAAAAAVYNIRFPDGSRRSRPAVDAPSDPNRRYRRSAWDG